jgi:Tfp pilus assembly protein PilN
VEILTPDRVGSALGVECADAGILAEASPVAVGLPLRLLAVEDGTPQVNLLPPEIKQKRAVRRHVLIAAVCAASLLVVMALWVMGLRLKIENRCENLVGQKATEGFEETVALVTQHHQVDARIEQVSQGQGRLEEVLKTQRQIDWPGLLVDVRDVTPKSLWLTRLISGASEPPEMLIDGWSVSYRDISLFVNKLNRSPYITSATVVKSGREELEGRMYFVYQIRCALDAKVGI